MKKVLVIKGRSAYNVLRKAADEIAEGFRAYGCETEVLDTQAEDFLVRLSGCLEQREQYAFCFSVQAIGWEQECTALPQLRDMRRVGWLVDDPFFHEARLIGSVGTGAYVLTVQDAFTQRISPALSSIPPTGMRALPRIRFSRPCLTRHPTTARTVSGHCRLRQEPLYIS